VSKLDENEMKPPIFQKWAALNVVDSDVNALLQSYGDGAYDEARTRAREARLGRVMDGNRPAGHWDKVRREIARRTGRQVGLDTATRYTES
jgi:hypothetical protein